MEALRSVGTPQFRSRQGRHGEGDAEPAYHGRHPLDLEQAKNAYSASRRIYTIRRFAAWSNRTARLVRIWQSTARRQRQTRRTGWTGWSGRLAFTSRRRVGACEVQGKGDLMQQWALIDAQRDLSVEARDDAKQRAQRNEAVAYQSEQRGAAQALC